MKTRRQRFARHFNMSLALALTLASFSLFSALPQIARAGAVAQEQQYGALQRGYRTGYSDGFQSGWSDSVKNAPRDFRGKADYRSADRAFIDAYGAREDYRDGYQQGFEVGYEAGFKRGGFDSNVPSGLSRRGATSADLADDTSSSSNGTRGSQSGQTADTSSSSGGDVDDQQPGASVAGSARSIPSNTGLLVELSNRISTDVRQRSDSFEARVVEPQEYEGAVVGGRLTNVQRAGKASGRSQLQLDFDKIRMPGGDWQDFNAQVIEVIQNGGEDNVGEVDPEGGIHGKSTTKDDVAKVGAGAGIGAIIGGIAGGGKGAGIGAIIGGAAGTAGAMTQRGKDIRFETGQQLRIRSTGK